MNNLYLSIFTNSPTLNHAIFSRSGGNSKAPFDSFNISFGVGDLPAHIKANREHIKDVLDLESLVSAKQVHSDKVLLVDSKSNTDHEKDGFDALITNIPNIGLMVQQADCQAIMLFDPVKNVIANIHSGWKGSILNIIATTTQAMINKFDTNPDNLLAGISPSLGPCCAEFVNYKTELPAPLHKYQVKPNYFDFWAISHDQLTDSGVASDNIEIAKICTMCNHDYFSYRRNKITGRFASVIALRQADG